MAKKDWLEKFRQWLDDEEPREDRADHPAEPRPETSQWQQFIIAIAREVEQVMLREAFTPPGEPTYIPREYIILLSKEDDQVWRGEKRRGLERGLYNALSERARELVGQQHFQATSFALELRVDGMLEPGKFRVQPVWDPQEEKTVISSKLQQQQQSATPTVDDEEEAPTVVKLPDEDETEDPTMVRYFTLRIERRDAGGQVTTSAERPIFKKEITIGRSKKSDLRLPDDPEISRHHATLTKGRDSYTLDCYGQNPIRLADGKLLPADESVVIEPGETFHLASYDLTIL